jgi:hypothetical protein
VTATQLGCGASEAKFVTGSSNRLYFAGRLRPAVYNAERG